MPRSPSRVAGRAFLGIAAIVVAFAILMTVGREQLFFPVLSSIAFPVLVAVPFLFFGLELPRSFKIVLGVIVAFLLIPALTFKDGFYLELAIQIGIFATLALGLNIVVGFAGLLDLGYVAFFAVGAYLWAIFNAQTDNFIHLSGFTLPSWTFYIFLFLAVIVAGGVGILLGLPVLRLRGDYLAIVSPRQHY